MPDKQALVTGNLGADDLLAPMRGENGHMRNESVSPQGAQETDRTWEVRYRRTPGSPRDLTTDDQTVFTQTYVEVLPLPPQIVVVNGLAVAVTRNADDHVIGVAERAVAMAGFSMDRAWEIEDEAGEILGYKDDPDAVRYVALKAGTAA